MIRFFRHIRKKLIEQDNARKYLLYAIGEILLVVIGILIALQVNNWNEERIINNQLETYYGQIRNEISSDLDRVDRQIDNLESIVSLNERSLNLLSSGNPDSLRQLQFTLGALATAWTVGYNYPVLQEFVENGFLPLVDDESLRFKLTGVQGLLEYNSEINSVIQNQYVQTIEPYVIETLNYQAIALDRYQPYLIEGGPEIDFTKFSNDLQLWNQITLKLESASLNVREQMNIRQELTELVELLNDQLDR